MNMDDENGQHENDKRIYTMAEEKPAKAVIKMGIPVTMGMLFMVVYNLAAEYRALTVAAMGIANKIMSFGNYFYQGMAAGCQPLMGYNYGAKNYDRMRKLIRSGVIVITCIELVIMVIYGFTAPVLIGIFTQSPEVIALGTKALRAFMLMLPFVGSTSLVRNTFNAIGKPLYAFGITIVRQLLLYIPFLLLFNSLWGFAGLIHAQPTEEFICMIFALALLFTRLRKMEQH